MNLNKFTKYQCEKCLSIKNHTYSSEWSKNIIDSNIKTKCEYRICEVCGHTKMINEMTVFNPSPDYTFVNIEPELNIIKF